jgi:crossover junction endodeoxyribonuclease RusA
MVLKLHPKLTKKVVASKTCIDLSNALKVTEDALEGVAFVDDANAQLITLELAAPKKDGGVTVIVEEIQE